MKKYPYLLIFVLVTAVIASFFVGISTYPQATAASSNLRGWAWSSNIGWLSFNSVNTGGADCGTYCVSVDKSTGNLSGYAWSSDLGWLSFNSVDLAGACPDTTPAHVNTTTGKVTGWAIFLTGKNRTDGWDGCVKLADSDPSNPLYSPDISGTKGVTLDTNTGIFKGFSWGSSVVGWLTFMPNTDINVVPPVNNPELVPPAVSCTVPSTLLPSSGGPITATINISGYLEGIAQYLLSNGVEFPSIWTNAPSRSFNTTVTVPANTSLDTITRTILVSAKDARGPFVSSQPCVGNITQSGAPIQLWFTNKPKPGTRAALYDQQSVQVRYGQNVPVSYWSDDGLFTGGCNGIIIEPDNNWAANSDWVSERGTGNGNYTFTNLEKGKYRISIRCGILQTGDPLPPPIYKDSNTLQFNVVESTYQEI